MERITIEMADDGRISVTAESDGEPTESMDFDNIEDAAKAVHDILTDAEQDMQTGEQSPDDEESMESMWQEEAAKRPKNPQMLG